MIRSTSFAVSLVGALLVSALSPHQSAAQIEAQPIMEGQVRRGLDPMSSAMVVLHRVDAVEAGEIDSIRTDGEGRFRFELPSVPDPGGSGEVYFASVRHQGLLYFGLPVGSAIQLDSVYSIQAWDTLQAPPQGIEIPIEVRYLLVESIPEGWQVTDLTQLRLGGQNTIVPAEGGVIWSYPLPAGIRNVQVGGGDIAPAAVEFDSTQVRLVMPLSPGTRQMMLRYVVDSINLSFDLPGEVEEFELLVLEPAPDLQVTGLVSVESINPSAEVTYRRYAASVMADSAVSVRQIPSPRELPVKLMAFLLAFLLTGAGLWAVMGRGAPGAVAPNVGSPSVSSDPGDSRAGMGPAPAEVRDRIVLAIAQLDEEMAGADQGRAASAAEERARLMERLREIS